MADEAVAQHRRDRDAATARRGLRLDGSLRLIPEALHADQPAGRVDTGPREAHALVEFCILRRIQQLTALTALMVLVAARQLV